MRTVAVLVMWSVVSGCVFKDRLIPVKPQELPKLNDISFAVMRASGPGGTASGGASGVVNVEAPDGTMAAITRPFAVEVTSQKVTLRFSDPVRSTDENGTLVVQGANRVSRFPMTDIASTAVVKREIDGPVFGLLIAAAIIVPIIVAASLAN